MIVPWYNVRCPACLPGHSISTLPLGSHSSFITLRLLFFLPTTLKLESSEKKIHANMIDLDRMLDAQEWCGRWPDNDAETDHAQYQITRWCPGVRGKGRDSSQINCTQKIKGPCGNRRFPFEFLADKSEIAPRKISSSTYSPVSYTHLTLPTICSV